jgi:hypothetical protein
MAGIAGIKINERIHERIKVITPMRISRRLGTIPRKVFCF